MNFTMKEEPFARWFLKSQGNNLSMKIAHGILGMATEMPLSIDTEVGLAASVQNGAGIRYSFGDGIICDENYLDSEKAANPEISDQIDTMRNIFSKLNTKKIMTDSMTPEIKLANASKVFEYSWGGHSNPDYGMLLRLGTDGIREKIASYRQINTSACDWYDSLLVVLDAMDVLGDRFCKLAENMLKTAVGKDADVLRKIAGVLKVIPKKPAYDFMSACQFFYMIFVFDDCDTPGYFGDYMIDFYRKTDKGEARRILEGLWLGFKKIRAWNLCIGGSDENWNDKSNELSYELLDVAQKYKFNTPNLTMRCHRNTPKALLEKAAEVIATGMGMPALYNDEVVCPALEDLGIPPFDSHLYAMNGCNQIDIQGKSHMGLEDGEMSLIKCLEIALFNGECQIKHTRIGPQTGDASKFTTYEQLYDAYKKQVEYMTNLVIDSANICQKVFAEHGPNPWRSCLIQGCIEKGKDFKAGGALYNHGQVLTQGLADTADSLAAIRHFVYEEKIIDMPTLLDALRKDFEGYDDLYLMLKNYEGKFGNDIDEVDEIAAGILDHYFTTLTKYRTYRDSENGIYGGGMSTFIKIATYARNTAATASGRHKSSPILADSIGAVPGCDKNGPTALIKSVLKYNQRLAKSGLVFNIKFDKKLFNTEKGRESFLHLLKTYFSNGGQQMSVNVVNAEDLIDAKKHPENHKNLIVRVGGFSEYFNNLEESIQDNIITRTAISL